MPCASRFVSRRRVDDRLLTARSSYRTCANMPYAVRAPRYPDSVASLFASLCMYVVCVHCMTTVSGHSCCRSTWEERGGGVGWPIPEVLFWTGRVDCGLRYMPMWVGTSISTSIPRMAYNSPMLSFLVFPCRSVFMRCIQAMQLLHTMPLLRRARPCSHECCTARV